MSDKAYKKIYVNGDCVVDFTESNITRSDVVAGKKFYNSQGQLNTGTASLSRICFSTDSSGTATYDIDLRDCFFDWTAFIKDFLFSGSGYVNYNITINKNSYIATEAGYSCGSNYGAITINCDESMTYSDVWNCLGVPEYSQSYSYEGNFITGIKEITGEIENTTELILPEWSFIPRYYIQIYCGGGYNNIETVTVPSCVEYLGASFTNMRVLRCLGEEPPELMDDTSLYECSYIEVPVGCKNKYCNADNWCNFADRIYEVGEVPVE